MDMEAGTYILKLLNGDGVEKDERVVTHFLDGEAKAKEWEEEKEGNKAILYRILYNTEYQNKKW